MSLTAVVLNGTLKHTPAISNTRSLTDMVGEILDSLGTQVEVVRLIDFEIPFGVNSDEGAGDQWPEILAKLRTADIVIFATPIWMNQRSSVMQRTMERLDGTLAEGNAKDGQYPLYGKVAGAIVTGNEDGAQGVAAGLLYDLQRLGCVVPPNADCYWVGDAGPGPSFIIAGGHAHHFTRRRVRYMAHSLVEMARILREHPLTTNLRELTEQADEESTGSRQQRHGDGCDW